jgi:hypothetical protein
LGHPARAAAIIALEAEDLYLAGGVMKGGVHSARELRRERLVGNWGGASEHIGQRWEELGLRLLRDRLASPGSTWPLDGYRPVETIELAGDDALQTALGRAGLPNPDLILIAENGSGERALQALDFKWNLEFASYGQIRAEAIEDLLEKGIKPLQALLARSIEVAPADMPVLDGLLFSPDLPVNRWFIDSEQNARQEYPIEPQEVVFQKVDPFEFFSVLPGWEMAVLVARVDRSDGRLQALETAEHYYRIGAGLLGAAAQLKVSVFVRQPPAVEAEYAMSWLRAKVRPPSSAGFVQHAEKLMAARGQLQLRLRNLTRSPFRFADLADALKVRGVTLPERESGLPPAERERWGGLLRRVATEHKEIIYRTGLRLTETGLSDAEALTRLEADSRRYIERARARAEQLINEALA